MKLIGLAVVAVWATTLYAQDAPGAYSLDALITRAPLVVVSTVTDRRAEWEHYGASRLIITKVTLEVEQTLKGSSPRTLTIDVMGGTIGDETQRVSHTPEFRVGDRDVLFLNNAPRSVSPLVGSDQGRFRVMTDSATGVARVLTRGFAPLVSAADIGADASAPGRPLVTSMAAALSLSDFVTIVRDRARVLEQRR